MRRTNKQTFEEYIDKYLGRVSEPFDKDEVLNNWTHHYTDSMVALVLGDIEAKNEYVDQDWYQEHKPKIRRLLKAAVMTTVWATGATEDIN